MLNLLKLYAVYVPHITEYIYQDFFRQHEKSVSLHRLNWEEEKPVDGEILRFGEELKGVIAETRKYKTEHALSLKAEIDEVVISTEGRYIEWFRQTADDIKACCRAKEIRYSQQQDF